MNALKFWSANTPAMYNRIISHSFIENVLDKAVFYVHEITFSIQSNGFLCNQPLFYSLSFKVYHSTTSI